MDRALLTKLSFNGLQDDQTVISTQEITIFPRKQCQKICFQLQSWSFYNLLCYFHMTYAKKKHALLFWSSEKGNKIFFQFLYAYLMEFALCENYREKCYNFKFDNMTAELCHDHCA